MTSSSRSFLEARDFLLAHRTDYEAARRDFRWPRLERFNWALDYFDEMAKGNDRTALWVVGETGGEVKLSFAELSLRSNQVANLLRGEGVRRGDAVLMMLGNVVPLWEVMLACMKLGAVIIPATTLLTTDDLRDRFDRGGVRHVVVGAADAAKFDALPGDYGRLVVGGDRPGWTSFERSREAPAELVADGPTYARDPLLLYFTSGTTAKPKLVSHTHESYPVGHLSTMYWIGLLPGDVHYNISSPGWAKHAWSNVFAPWNAGATVFSHDIVASDKRDPSVNANGNVYFGDWHNDTFTIVDPNRNADRTIPVPTLDDRFSFRPFTRQTGWANPGLTFGDEVMVQDFVAPSSLTMDQRGRVWISARVSNSAPDFCQPGSGNPYAAVDPTTDDAKDLAVYDPATGQWDLVPTCYGSNHPTMAVDGTNKVFIQGGDSRFLWVDTDVWTETRDAEAAQGWCRLFYDSDGDGLPNMDAPVDGAPYGPQQSLVDGSIWGTVQTVPGRIIRLTLGDNPPRTCVGEAYNVPEGGSFSRGVDVDSNGVVWTGLAGSGHLASFDRRRCEGSLTGPEAMIGDHCPEGWTLYPTPGPRMTNTGYSADFHYYNFIDKYNVIGLGPDTPLVNGTNSDSLMALVDPETNEWVAFRLPYPIGGLYTRNMSVRVDDPNAGWKGTGLWAANDTRAVWHGENGRESQGLVVKFQLRPDPLAH
jgi:streptogramin lyase